MSPAKPGLGCAEALGDDQSFAARTADERASSKPHDKLSTSLSDVVAISATLIP